MHIILYAYNMQIIYAGRFGKVTPVAYCCLATSHNYVYLVCGLCTKMLASKLGDTVHFATAMPQYDHPVVEG